MNTKDSIITTIERFGVRQGLERVTDANRRVFRRMYGSYNDTNTPKRTQEEALEVDINVIVDELTKRQLNSAITQVANTLRKMKDER